MANSLFIDIHSHLDHPLIKDLDDMVAKAKAAGIRHIITNGVDPKTNRISLELSKKYDIVECALGLYPRDALKKEVEGTKWDVGKDFDVDTEINFIRAHKNGIVAISEIGLDGVNGVSPSQIEDFSKMLELAKELDKPVVIHSRKAEEQCIELLKSHAMKKVVMHCFCGKKRLVKEIMDNNWSITIPTSIVRAQQFQDIAKIVPITQLFCETDTPYLSPIKGQWNEPTNVIESYKKIAEIKGMELFEVGQNIYMNYQRLFC
jgi:TatD DNase family protein